MSIATRLSLVLVVLLHALGLTAQTRDTIRLDDGAFTQANTMRAAWEESVILTPKAPCTVLAVQIYYATTGSDTVRITGDAAEGTIPPTQYCFAYNTLGRVVHTVTAPGWKTIDLSTKGITLGGLDRVVVQHIINNGVALWGQDAAQGPATSFLYDALTPNPNFLNIPGIFYRSSGDYLVRLIVEYPTIDQPMPTWTDVTDLVGLVNGQGARLKSDLASAADINGDGWDDVIIGNIAYLNDQGQGFTRSPLPIQASGTVWADLDNDGDLDCFAVYANGAEGRTDGLWENNGAGGLTDRTAGSGLEEESPTVTPLFLDYDHDGDLDLFIANGRRTVNNQEEYFQDRLYRNNGNFTFTNVTLGSAISAAEPAPYQDCWGASLADVNLDGWTDIFVATYRLAPDRLYINNGNGTFTESSQATGAIGVPTAVANYFGHGMGSDWADIDNDGDLDLAVGNLGHPDQRGQYSNPSLILMNTGSNNVPRYTNNHSLSADGTLTWHGVSFREMNAGMCFADFDHDGLQDLYHGQISYDQFGAGATRPAHFYVQGASRFVDRTWETGLFIHGSWTGVRLDFDRDGDMDLLAASGRHEVRLFRNDLPKRGNSVVLLLENSGTEEMPSTADGSTIRVYAGGKMYLRQTPGTVIGGRCSQMSRSLHVGVGAATTIDSVVVAWPTGKKTTHTDVVVNTTAVLLSNGMLRSSGLGAPRLIMPEHHAVRVPARPTLSATAAEGLVEIQVSTSADFSTDLISLTQLAGEVTLTEDLQEGVTYWWRARYERGPAVGPWSSVWQFTVGSPRPTAPVIIRPVMNSKDNPLALETEWSAASASSSPLATITYEIELIDETDGPPVCTATDLTDTAYTCNLQPLTTYEVRVRAYADGAPGPWSESVVFTTYGTPSGVTLMLPADMETNVPIRPRLEWEEHPSVDSGYVVEYSINDDFTDAIQKERLNAEYRIISALSTGRTYYWRVRGRNQAGEGAWSPVWSFTVEGTVGVADDEALREDGQVIVYDLLGKTLFTGTHAEWKTRSPRYGLIVLVARLHPDGRLEVIR